MVRVTNFKRLWLGAVDHYVEKWTSSWQKKYLKTIQAGLLCSFFLFFPRITRLFVILFQFTYLQLDSEKKKKKLVKEIKKYSADRIRSALTEFLEPLSKDCEFFVYNQRTFGNESFHGLCNRYYEKGSAISFPVFVMKRQFAFLDWNEQMRKKANGQKDADIQDWQKKLLKLLRKALLG